MTVQVSDVENLKADKWSHLDSDVKSEMLDMAKSETDTMYSNRVSRLNEIEGERDFFIKNLAAHKFEIATGGEQQSESGGGGNVNYNTVTGQPTDPLSETRYGRTCLGYLREHQSVGVVLGRGRRR